MSYRPTISVYINHHVADVGYYRNWDDKSLFYEAMTIAMLYGDCKSIEEYKDRKYGRQKVYISIEPKIWEDTEENLLELAQCPEFPIMVDVTAQCIYSSDKGALNWREIGQIPSILEKKDNYGYETEYKPIEDKSIWDDWDWGKGYPKLSYEKIKVPVKLDKISEQTDFYKVMRYSRIPFGHINQEEFLDILQEWNEAGYHLSKGTVDQIRKRRDCREISNFTSRRAK